MKEKEKKIVDYLIGIGSNKDEIITILIMISNSEDWKDYILENLEEGYYKTAGDILKELVED